MAAGITKRQTRKILAYYSIAFNLLFIKREQTMTTDYRLIIKPTNIADLEHFFQFQLDDEAIYLAAFTPKDPADKKAYIDKISNALSKPTTTMRTIFVNDNIVGSVAKFDMEGEAHITYWIDKAYWGKGVTTQAFKEFLIIETTRPIFGSAAFDNFASQRVMEKCGFEKIGTDKGFANARNAEIEEFIYKLI